MIYYMIYFIVRQEKVIYGFESVVKSTKINKTVFYLYTVKAQIDKKLFNKKKKGKDKDQKKEIAVLEAQIYRLIEILGEQREMTRDNVERKQARTEDERIEDEDDEFIEEEEEGRFLSILKIEKIRFFNN